ncbi:Allophanate hydrolase [Gracilariopsis chorda]|uniref:Allophanate hydrolase n=1 Tax=Gracilariopsis chorda TaxID=448386 RepID=A0A2V3J603_9FLOR|nr:Allophanate hydrolase [Gracilariopsis chorda]|eukprot:PXF49804.1 Allophanate hydrolase [Gracilariopsis chorda]
MSAPDESPSSHNQRPLTLQSFRSKASSLAELRAFYVDLHSRAKQTESVFISLSPLDEIHSRLEDLHACDPDHKLPLHGVPFAVKDNIDAPPLKTTAACPGFAYSPDTAAFVVNLLEAAGAVALGKANMDQFACGLTGMRSPYGVPANPCNSKYIPGGSSSGSAVSVALGLVVFSLGTDTAGSGRVPAAMNNIVGLKPTKGLLSTSGIVPASASQDCVSIFANTVDDAAFVLHLTAKYDQMNPYTRIPPPDKLPKTPAQIGPMDTESFTFGVPTEKFLEFRGDAVAEKAYAAAIDRLELLGGEKVEIDFAPFQRAAAMLYGSSLVSERYAAVGDFLKENAGQESAGLNPSVFLIIMGGREGQVAHDVFMAQEEIRRCVKIAERDTWSRVNFLVVPSVPCAMTTLQVANDPIGLNKVLGTYTNFVNLMDLCAVALPATKTEGRCTDPRGITLVARAFEDNNLVRVARHFETGIIDDEY